MWIYLVRPQRPDASQWAGRRSLAVVDAIAWPALWIALIATAPFAAGVTGWVSAGLIGLVAIRRLHRAIWRNERYWFTTWRWGAPLSGMVLAALAIKLLV